jgi:hypothetical protein
LALAAILGLPAVGCSDGGRRSGLRFEVAPAAGAGCGGAPSTFQVGCVELTLCESDDPTSCVVLAPSGGPYPTGPDDEMQSILVPSVGGSIRFDARVDPTLTYDLDVVAFGQPGTGGRSGVVAVGHQSRVAFDGSPATVWLYPVDGWTCPGNTSTRLRRAFHQSVALSNGDALIFGGIVFEPGAAGLPIAGVSPTVELVPAADSVYVFDARTETLDRIDTVNGDAELLRRAFSEGRWVERTASDGVERIRLFGGVMGDSLAQFTLSPGQLPVSVRVEGAEPAPTVDVLYDPAARTITVDSTMTGTFETVVAGSTAALPVAAERQRDHFALVGTSTSAPQYVTSVARIPALAGFGSPLAPERLLPTMSPVTGGWLVYGGNVSDTTDLAVNRAVLIGSTDGRPRPLTLPDDLTPSVLHTATSVNGTVVAAGGLAISGLGVATPVAAASAGALRVVRPSLAGDALVALPVTGADPERERIYHAALRDEASRVLVIGGSTREGTSQFHEVSSAFAVEVEPAVEVSPLPALRQARFGHSAVLLRGGRVLVTGGLRRGQDSPESASSLYLVDEPELLVVRDVSRTLSCEAGTDDAGMASVDAGASRDSGPAADAGPTSDAGAGGDAGLSPGLDAGM